VLCYMHVLQSREISAVAICTHCGVGLCLEHLVEREAPTAGGTRLDCPHVLPTPGRHAEVDGQPRPRGSGGLVASHQEARRRRDGARGAPREHVDPGERPKPPRDF
jgi:Uncharacterized protein conserved in archaea (DUF2180)